MKDIFGIPVILNVQLINQIIKIDQIIQYLDYKNCKFKTELIIKLVEEFNEDANRNELIYNGILNNYTKI